MNLFSVLQDIDRKIRIFVSLESVWLKQQPIFSLRINGHTVYDQQEMRSHCGAVYHVGLTDPICLEIELHRKDYNLDHSTAVRLKEISIDYLNLIPNFTHHARYINDHDWNHPTTELGFNGVWQFFLDEPFYQWQHRVTGQGWLLKPQY